MKLPEREHIIIPLMLGLILVLFHLLDFKNLGNDCLGIQPYTLTGLKGVIFSPLLHSNWSHLFGNLFPLMALIFLCFQFYGKFTYWVIILGWIAVGLMVWAFPITIDSHYAQTCHIGASGLVYVLAFFLGFAGIFDNKRVLTSLLLLIVVGFGSMVWGIFPEEFFGIEHSRVSWQSHLSGAIVGIALSYWLKGKSKVEDKKFEWEGKKDMFPQDEALWNRYQDILRQWEEEDKMEELEKQIEEYYAEKNRNST